MKFQSFFSIRQIPYWFAALTTGGIAVGFAQLIDWAEKTSQYFAEQHGVWFLILGPTFFVMAWAIVHFFAPEARGSGIPQVMAAIESHNKLWKNDFASRIFGWRIIFIKVLSSVLCVLGGGAIGREGPTIQISASIFHIIEKKSKSLTRHLSYEHWIIAGAAAGVAAAFNTPLGGLVYGIEELSSSHFNRFKTSLIAAVILAGLAAQSFAGTYLYLGYPNIGHPEFNNLLWAIVVGAISGFSGAALGELLVKLGKIRSKVQSIKGLFFISASCGFFMAFMAWLVDPQILGPGKKVLDELLFSHSQGGHSSFLLCFMRWIGVAFSYFSGSAGGVFAPSLAAGGALGGWIADLIQSPNSALFVLMGMTAFLSGITHAPFTAFVLVLEMTDRHSAIFPLMLSSVVGLVAARILHEHSFYEQIRDQYLEQLRPLPK